MATGAHTQPLPEDKRKLPFRRLRQRNLHSEEAERGIAARRHHLPRVVKRHLPSPDVDAQRPHADGGIMDQ